ncbi:MAG: DNA mismatch repair protein MutS [Clostridiales bacterium]|nr:DNA mismatch repair protein MutS [Clostridiales bacterium]
MKNLTPMMKQYLNIKEKYKDTLLFFRLGDFYELFFDDAIIASKELEIALTGRDCGLEERAPMCGVPHHAADSYINKLVANGYKVAICEQVEDPAVAKGIVKRDVVRVITPGTLIDTDLLEEKTNNYLMCIFANDRGIGISYVDISTGELFATQIIDANLDQKLQDEISKTQPKEIIYNINDDSLINIVKEFHTRLNTYISNYDDWHFEYEYCINQIKDHFNILSLDGLGFEENDLSIHSTGALFHYLKTTQKRTLNYINKINIYDLNNVMLLDLTTRRNLELTKTIRENSKKGSLLWVLDKTKTSMGGRMLRKWIEEPLIEVNLINERLDLVEIFKEDILLRKEIEENLKNIYDLERLSAKISYGTANPRDLIALKNSLSYIPNIIDALTKVNHPLLQNIIDNVNPHTEIKDLIDKAILDNPSPTLKEGNIIKIGYNEDIDRLKLSSKEAKSWIANLESVEREKTGIKSLKVGYNRVFGYYIEVTKSNLSSVPDRYIRKQTLANSERYIIPELKEMESKILSSEEKIIALEYELFLEIRSIIEKEIPKIQNTAHTIAKLDALYSLAETAYENRYEKPEVNNNKIINISMGRHPVVEKMLNNNMFVPNDTYIDPNKYEISIITGPNMAGKSTYMRQVALIVLMAQIGSFVPADSATIGIVDRIFTRVGASDDLSQGQSTFMVEMSEMANILNNATPNSLVILDEVGRGTSTYDGLSIAWSIIEYISEITKCKTLFSTHYHELSELEGLIRGVKNYKISVKEEKDNIIFLRKVKEGSADKSYGIQVAKLAGLPADVIKRAEIILNDLEKKDIINSKQVNDITDTISYNHKQLNFFDTNYQKIIDEIKNLNLLETTPIAALNILNELQKKVEKLELKG